MQNVPQKTAVNTAAQPSIVAPCIAHPSSPKGGILSFILYADGITPGAVLSPENRRKAFVWYGSFLEFRRLLAYEEMWCALAVARTCLALLVVYSQKVAVIPATINNLLLKAR